MRFSLNWLRDYFEPTVDLDRLLSKLTLAGTEVEDVEERGKVDDKVVVAQILSSTQHPDADRLSVCQVDDGQGERQIVCGAKNYKVGDKVPLALPGATVISPKDGSPFKIKAGKLRGEKSEGMLCSAKELLLADDADGLLILDPDAPVGHPLKEVIQGDTLVEVEVTPNRPDLLSYLGLAREMAATNAGQLKEFTYPTIKFPETAADWKVELASPEAGPFYSATLLQGLKVGPSPSWLASRIEAMGHKPINNVVDITNYVLYETGQPLHAFDVAKLTGHTISVRQAKEGEAFRALDEETYELTAKDLVIANANGPVALAGVMGGLDSGVSESTTDILLEAAWFNPSSVRYTSRRLGLISDSSYRFERRVDPAAVLQARDRAIALLLECCGGEVGAAPVVAGEAPVIERDIRLRVLRVGKVIGVGLPAEIIDNWLSSLGLERLEVSNASIEYRIPSFRPDLEREIDLIEEIARLHGMDGVPSRINLGVTPESPEDRAHQKLCRLRSSLAGRGWNECVTDTLVEARWTEGEPAPAVGNPLNEQYTHLRSSLKASLLAVAGRNLSRGVPGVKLFELGKVFQKKENQIEEGMHLALLVAGQGAEEAWYQDERPSDFADLKGILDDGLARFHLKSEDILEQGQVLPSLAKTHGLKVPVFFAEVDLGAWLERPKPIASFEALPTFPPVRRDIAIIVDRALPHQEVVQCLESLKLKHLVGITLFDVFTDDQGEKIPTDKKSLAYALTYRAADRTLTDKEVAGWQNKVRSELEKSLGATFRDA